MTTSTTGPDPTPAADARPADASDSAERRRLDAARTGVEPWRRWGPYLADRQWGTVREDYSAAGAAWDVPPA